MRLMLRVGLLVLALAVSDGSRLKRQAIACTALENVPGACIALRDCRVLADKIRQDPRNDILIQDIRRTSEVCTSFSPVHVCCPGVVAQIPTTAARPVKTVYSGNPDGLTPGLKLPTFEDGCGVWQISAVFHKIIFTRPVQLGTWPWVALLGYESSSGVTFNCGGTIITKRHVLTAAGCINDNLVLVRFGEHVLNNYTEPTHVDINIRKAVRHSGFDKDDNAGRNDIAIIYMEQDIPFTDLIKPVCLPTDDNNYIGYHPLTARWGKESKQSPETPSLMQHVQVKVYQNDICESYLRMSRNITQKDNIDEMFICAGHLGGPSVVCEGDPGSPLIAAQYEKRYYFIQIGIISSRAACDTTEFLRLYTRTSYYLDWIKEKIGEPF